MEDGRGTCMRDTCQRGRTGLRVAAGFLGFLARAASACFVGRGKGNDAVVGFRGQLLERRGDALRLIGRDFPDDLPVRLEEKPPLEESLIHCSFLWRGGFRQNP